jgi:hypothetical protein
LPGALDKESFFKKIKNIFADGEQATTLGKGFFQKIEIIFADDLTQALGTYFLRKIKNPHFADGPAMRPSAKRISKTVNFPL